MGKKVVGQSYAFSPQIDSGLRRIILFLNEEVGARDIPGFMATSDGIRRKLFFEGKFFYCGRCHSKHTFYEGCPFQQEDEEQQPQTEQNKNREQQDLPEATAELYQDAETPSERIEVEQNDVALGQPTAQEGGAEATLGNGSELESDCPSASGETQQQPNAVVQGEEVWEVNKTAAGNRKKEILIAIPPPSIENQRLNTGKSLPTRDAQKRNGNAEGGTKKKKIWGRFKFGHKKR